MAEIIRVPRSFKLLEEHDASIGKLGKTFLKNDHASMIQYGCVEQDSNPDPLRFWQGMLFGIQGKQCGEAMYNFVVDVPPNYPDVPPQVRILQPKLAMKCVDAEGYVRIDAIQPSFRWNHNHNIADLLMAIRENMKQGTVSKDSLPLMNEAYTNRFEPWK